MKSLKRKTRRAILLSVAVANLGMPTLTAHAEDIDIYKANPSTADNPNVLIVLDNSTNWSRNEQHWEDANNGIPTTQGEMELKALRSVIGELSSEINVGLLMLTGGSGGNPDGGYIRFDIRPMDATNKAALQELVGNPTGCTDAANSLNGTPNCILKNYADPAEKVATAQASYSNTLFEIFKYFGGYTSPAHAMDNVAGTPTDASHFGAYRYSGDPDPKSDGAAYSTDAAKTTYVSPITSDTNCAKNYVIWLGNDPNLNVDSAASLLSGVGGNTAVISVPNMTATTATESRLLATTACGTYADTASCQAAAQTAYGSEYASYACNVANVCSAAGTTTVSTPLGVSACGVYASAANCQTALATTFGATYSSYSCTAAGGSCSFTTTLSPPVVVNNNATCTSAGTESECLTWAAANYPAYASFSCTNKTSCSPPAGGKSWTITAGESKATGQQYTMTGSNVVAVPAGTSHHIYGQSTFYTYATNGTFSVPATNNYADEWSRFLYQTDVNAASGQQNVKTFTIDVRRLWKNDGDRDKTQLLMSMATSGGGKYFNAQGENAIKNALRRIFAEVQSVNSVFASSSLPVSVTEQTQSIYLNQIFIGMFRPAGTAEPRWPGNLKQYKFRQFSGRLRMADKNNEEAISSTTGFITPCSDSFWSADSGTYWNFSSSSAIGSCNAQTSNYPTAGSPSYYSDAPDGDVVEKGGAAQRLRGVSLSGGTIATSTRHNTCPTGETPSTYACRVLKTCNNASCTTLTDFVTGNADITDAALGVPYTSPLDGSVTTRDGLVNWIRGKDVYDENMNGNLTEMRPSAHGGVIHSQPAVIDFGTTTGVFAFYGGDDGIFRAVDGGQGDAEGVEVWGFIPPETYSRFLRLKNNEPLVSFPGIDTALTPTPVPKDYFFDGSIGVHQRSGTTWIFPTMRRGGRAIYAFDVSTPTAPTLKWRKGCFTNSTSDDSNCSTGWSGIGQTWSKPQMGFIQGYVDGSGIPKPVIVMGGGYDTCEDAPGADGNGTQTRCATTPRKGANVWVIDADTGALLRVYPTNYSVPGDVHLYKDSNDYIRFIYAGDTGGYVYRINVGTYDGTAVGTFDWTASGWTANTAAANITIAALSETNHARKFLFGPDVIRYGGYYYVLVGTGDRERPLAANYPCSNYSATAGNYVTNQFFGLKDVPSSYPATPVVPADLTDVTDLSALPVVGLRGWRLQLNACEQVVNKPLTVAGVTYFGTNQPAQSVANSCVTNLGTARAYGVDFETGGLPLGKTSRSMELLGGGLPPSAVAGVADVDGQKTPFCLGCGADPYKPSPLEGSEVEVNPSGPRQRLYWYMLTD